MPHFEVQILRSVMHTTSITVEADDEDEAEKFALERVEDPDANPEAKALEWDFEDETFQVESTDETDPPEDEEDEDEEDEPEEDEPEDTAAQ